MPKDRRLRENGARWEKRGGEEGDLPLKKISGEEWRRGGKGGKWEREEEKEGDLPLKKIGWREEGMTGGKGGE